MISRLKTRTRLLLGGSLMLALTATPASAQLDVNWIGADNAAYDVNSNWDGGVPGFFENDVAVIGSVAQLVGVANLNSTPTSPGALVLGRSADSSGTLNVTSGSLSVQDQSLTTGRIWVGDGGVGVLNVSGGALSSATLSSNAASTINLTGGSLSVSAATLLGGTLSVTGAAASVDAGNFVLTGGHTYAPTITGGGITQVNSAGYASLGGELAVTFSGAPAPSIGATWDLVEASSFVGPMFNAVTVSGAGDLPEWQRFRVAAVDAGGGRQTAQLQLVEALRLSVDPSDGSLSIVSGTAGGVAINGYRIESSADRLANDGGSWSTISPANGWNIANASAASLTELKSTAGGLTVTQSGPVDLGTPYQVTPASLPFGEVPGDDLTFTYNTPDGETVQGLVELVGGDFFNNFVLTIDPDDGMAELKNDSNYSVAFDSYQLTSAAGALAGGDWAPLGGDWQVGNPTQVNAGSQLAELNPSGSRTLAPGQRVLLGNIFPLVGSVDPTEDLSLIAANSDESASIRVINAAIQVAEIDPFVTLQGDFNGDGVVNAADYTVWRDNLNATTESVINNAGNGDSVVDQSDYAVWRDNYGAAGAPAASQASATPEPSAAVILLLAIVAIAGLDLRRQGSRRTLAVVGQRRVGS